MTPDERIIKSYVWFEGECFFVSTIDRDSSSMMGGRFAETLVWRFDWEKNERLPDTLMNGCTASEGSIHGHIVTCQRIHDTGSPYLREEEFPS